MKLRDVRFAIHKENQTQAFRAVKSLIGHETIRDSTGAHFSFVDSAKFSTAATLEEVLKAWRWLAGTEEDGSLIIDDFLGEKYGDDDLLFATLAPYLEPGSYIEMNGERTDLWRWVFDGQYVYKVPGRALFGEPNDENRIEVQFKVLYDAEQIALHIKNTNVLARAQGCLLGQLTGDALGSMVEFKGAQEIARLYPQGLREIGPSPVWHTLAGQPTDDSEMALSLARALVREGFSEQAAANAYADWIESHPFDVGATTHRAVGPMSSARARNADPVAAAHAAANVESAANGALMRESPLAIWGQALDPITLDSCARADARLTHPHRMCQDASAAYIVALAATIREGLDGASAFAHACAWQQAHGISRPVMNALEAARERTPNYEDHQGFVLIALQNAFYQALHAPTFADGVVATVMGGGDTDTNAAIVGALLGAIHGVDAIPAQWRQAVLTCRPRRGAPGVQQPRPEPLWPVDALELAEQLLAAGRRAAGALS